jgi:hypothetical protein
VLADRVAPQGSIREASHSAHIHEAAPRNTHVPFGIGVRLSGLALDARLEQGAPSVTARGPNLRSTPTGRPKNMPKAATATLVVLQPMLLQ